MSAPILATKLYIPSPRPKLVLRPRLIEQINGGLNGRLTLISAPAGFGKTTVVSEWIAESEQSVAWLSLDEGDNDPARFLTYLVAALQTIVPTVGESLLSALQSLQPPQPDSMMAVLLNDLMSIPNDLVLVIDDYHIVDSKPVDDILTFLLEHLPPQIHLIITTREDPPLPLARLRARGQMTELRIADLRFTRSEAAGFLNQVMKLNLSEEDISALETRTEGWIAGLQLAALSMQQHQDTSNFIKSFTGSHHFVLDYLVEEVLHQQSESVQDFLLRTSILNRMCGPLCEAILNDSAVDGQEALEYLEQANLFIVPLDNERLWYRYHHLFVELLRQRMQQSNDISPEDAAELHIRASQWYEDNDLDIEAFHHATAANDIERAERLIEGDGMPLHFRGAVLPVLNWLKSLPTSILDEYPSLYTAYASVLLVTGQSSGVDQILLSAEAVLQQAEQTDKSRDLIGRFAAIRATKAASAQQVETIISESQRALEYLHPDNLPFRTSTAWKLGFAYHLQGDRAAARKSYEEVISTGQASGNVIFTIMATIGLGSLQQSDNQLYLAAQTFQRVLDIFGDQPLPVTGEVHHGLAQIYYEWNDIDRAFEHAQQSVQLAQPVEGSRIIFYKTFLARLTLARGDVAEAVNILATVDRFVRQQKLMHLMPEVAATQVLTLLYQGNLTAATHLVETHNLPLSQARVQLAQGDPSAALAVLEPFREQMEAREWHDERLKAMVLQAVALHMDGDTDVAVQVLSDALAMAAAGGFIRIFVDEGRPMTELLPEVAAHGIMPDYIEKLLEAFDDEGLTREEASYRPTTQPLIEPLSERELEVLHLVAQGLSNREISDRLFLALSTVKGHNQRIFGKLAVQRRTEAVARARELGLL